jgi:hypothetical protein
MNETCGCCEGIERLTPIAIINRPGLDALTYRVGTHASFLETMLARLSNLGIPRGDLDILLDKPADKHKLIYPLRSLTTRSANDPAIALLDAWAIVADVLTFYQERIANEGYLRTATERRSILELARLVGYTLRPGVAASVYLAYTLEKDHNVTIPRGSRAQSVPTIPGELPQSFETAEPLEAHFAWNTLQPRLTRPQVITPIYSPEASASSSLADKIISADTIYFQGTATRLKPGDALLFVFNDPAHPNDPAHQFVSAFATITSVELQAAQKRTRVRVDTVISKPSSGFVAQPPSLGGLVDSLTTLPSLSPRNAQQLQRKTEQIFNPQSGSNSLLLKALNPALGNTLDAALSNANVTPPPALIVDCTAALRVKAFLFGHDIHPLAFTVQGHITTGAFFSQILPTSTEDLQRLLPLDAEYDQITIGSWVVVESIDRPLSGSGRCGLRFLTQTNTVTITDFLANGIRSEGSWELARDTFQRNDQPLWGTTSEEQSWDGDANINGAFSISNHAGLVSKAGNTHCNAILGDTVPDAEVYVTGWISSFVNSNFGAVLRWTNNNNWYKAFIDGSNLLIQKKFEGLTKILAGVPFAARAGTAYRLRFRVEGLTLAAKVWAASDPKEPSGWMVTARDSSLSPIRTFHRVTNVQTISLSLLDLLFRASAGGSTGPSAAATQPDPSNPSDPVTASLAITKKITLLTLDSPWLLIRRPPIDLLTILRTTTIYAQSECLPLSEIPTSESTGNQSDSGGSTSQCILEGNATIELDSYYADLKSGQWLIISGERADVPGTSGIRASELVMLAGVTQDAGKLPDSTDPIPDDKRHTFLQLARPLSFKYKCETVTISGNVVRATHGETRSETLGSGDGSKALQSFTLRQSPLTYLAAPTPAGVQSTLEVRVNDILWHKAASLADLGPTDRNYTTETDDAGKTTVIFGNGQYGARLPTGIENVKALYRTGIGKAGNVRAEQINQLAAKPLGVKSVINPQEASGGADKESRDTARRNVPLALLALDRLVSVGDYEDFARTYAGIGKASATRIPLRRQQVVHLSIVGADNIPINKISDLYLNLVQALQQSGDPNLPLQVDICKVMFIVIIARVRLLPDYQWEPVEARIRTTLLETFSFERRNLGQPVFESEVFSAVQGVTGVDYVELQILGAVDQEKIVSAIDQVSHIPPDPSDPQKAEKKFLEVLGLDRHKDIPVKLAQLSSTHPNTIDPAELAFLTPEVPETLILTEIPQ